METFKEMETVVTVNGKELEAIVRISTDLDSDFDSSDIDFENEEQVQQFQRMLDRGEIEARVILVEVTALGETGSDSLCQVLVKTSEDVDNAVAEHNMIEDATNNLIEELKFKYENLNVLFCA